LKKKLAKFELQSATRRKSRAGKVRVALVGYTNVGKSTLMNLLTKTDILAENKLFATVDSTIRKMAIEGFPFLLSDTVGFIRKLPTHLIEAFKSTLDEIVEADILLHVVDVSHPSFEEHLTVVNQTLIDIGATEKPTLYVFNKIDQYKVSEEFESADQELQSKLEHLEDSYFSTENSVFISASRKINIDELRRRLVDKVKEKYYTLYPNYIVN
jgi:GTP-binding protein HflX